MHCNFLLEIIMIKLACDNTMTDKLFSSLLYKRYLLKADS